MTRAGRIHKKFFIREVFTRYGTLRELVIDIYTSSVQNINLCTFSSVDRRVTPVSLPSTTTDLRQENSRSMKEGKVWSLWLVYWLRTSHQKGFWLRVPERKCVTGGDSSSPFSRNSVVSNRDFCKKKETWGRTQKIDLTLRKKCLLCPFWINKGLWSSSRSFMNGSRVDTQRETMNTRSRERDGD